MTAQLTRSHTRPPLLWWEGVGSPGVGGYVLADLAAVGALAVILPLSDGTAQGIGNYLVGMLVVAYFGCVGSIPLALVGIPIVHFCCLRVRSQAVHVLAAGAVGFAIVALPVAVSSGELATEGLWLGLGTATGRAAVIPLARRRQS